MTDIQLAFEVTGSVHQRIRIVRDDWNEEKIIDGLRDGLLATTTDHDGVKYCNWVEVVETGEHIGLILSQEIEGEYFDYR